MSILVCILNVFFKRIRFAIISKSLILSTKYTNNASNEAELLMILYIFVFLFVFFLHYIILICFHTANVDQYEMNACILESLDLSSSQ